MTARCGFDPYQHGLKDGLGFWGAVANHLKSVIGTGILVMPFVYKNLGYVMGTWLTLLVGVTYYHCIHILLSVEFRLCQRKMIPNMTFIGVIEEIFANASPITKKVGIFFKIATYTYFGNPMSCSLYLMVATSNVKNVVAYFEIDEVPRIYIITVLFVPLMILSMINGVLKFLVPFSALSNGFMLVMAGIVIVSPLIYGTGPTKEPLKAIGDPVLIPQFLGIILLVVRSTGIIIPLKNSMNDPQRFSIPCGVLNVSAVVSITIYLIFGFTNYCNYSQNVQDNILLNLPSQSSLTLIILLFNTWNVCVSYVLCLFVSFHTVYAGNFESKMSTSRYKKVCECGIKLVANSLAYILAVLIPQLSLLTSISGTVGILVEIILLPLLEILYIAPNKKNIWQILVVLKNLAIIIVGTLIFCTSLFHCICKIVKFYS